MRYLLLVYEDERQSGGLPPDERRALARACDDSDAALRRSGYLLAAEPIEERGAVVVVPRGGRASVSDGPATPADARLRAVVTLQARDLNEAIQVAAAMPQARLGPIEVRPVRG